MFLTNRARTAAVVVVAALLSPAPIAIAEDDPPERSLDAGRVDVADISLAEGAMSLGADDGTGQPRDPESLVYTTGASGVEVGWDTGGIDPGQVFGDAVRLRLLAADGPAEFQVEPLRLPVGERGALTWTFPAAGRYTLVFAVEAYLLTGEPVRTEEQYTVEVRTAQPETPIARAEPMPEAALPEAALPEAGALPAAPLAAAKQSATTPGRVVLDQGHVDAVAARLLDGELQIQVKDGVTVGQAGGQVHWREPGDVVFHAKSESKAALPDDAALAFLGGAGEEIFLLPQQQQAGILWTGWSTEELRADQVTGPVTWRLTEVDGPGAFGIFTTGSFGDSTVIFNSTDGLPDSHSIALGTHAHANWGFAEQGVYRLTFGTAATLSDGRTVSDTEVYTFAVGDVDPNNLTPAGTDDRDPAAGGDSRDPRLAYTGPSGVLPLTAGGFALLGLGGAAVVVSRRRRQVAA